MIKRNIYYVHFMILSMRAVYSLYIVYLPDLSSVW